MNWWIDIELPDGSKAGPGPLRSATAFEVTRRLDAAGKFKLKASLSEPRASMVQAKRRARCWGLITEVVTDLGAGIIDKIGVDTDLTLDISGDDLLRELTYHQVGRLLVGASGAPSTTGPAQIAALFPTGWSLDVANGHDATIKAIHHRFEGESCLAALCKLAEITGEHFRLGIGRTVIWMQNDRPISGVRAIQGGESIALESNLNVCVITDLQEEQDSYDCLIGRLYAYGIGNGDARITLSGITIGVTGWTIGNDTKGYYLQHTDTWSAYGIERYTSFKDISDGETLMEAAYEWMVDRLALQAAYKISIAKLDRTIPVGSTLRVIYRRILDRVTVLDIDADLVVLETTTKLDADGLRTTALKVATVDVWPDNDTSAMVDGLGQSQKFYTHDQDFGKGTTAEFLVLAASTSLPNERIFTPDATLTTVDDGAGGAYHIGVNASGIGSIIASAFGDIILFNPGDVPVFYDNTSTGFDAALTAAATGAYIHVPAGEITGVHSIPADVTVGGHGLATIFSGALTCAGFLVNVQCEADIILSGDGAYFIFNPDGDTLTSHNFLVGGNAETVPVQKGTIIAGANEDAAIHYRSETGGVTSVVLTYVSQNYLVVDYANVYVDDNVPAQPAADATGAPSAPLVCRINPGQLPAGFVITGFAVNTKVKCHTSGADECRDYEIQFVNGVDAVISDNKATLVTWPWGVYEYRVYGSAVDDWNIVGLTTALVNSGDLAFWLTLHKDPLVGGLWVQGHVDYIEIEIFGDAPLEYVAGLDVTETTWAVEPGDTLTGAGLEFNGVTGTLKIPATAPEPPLTVASTVMIASLNADLLDGQHAAAFQTALSFPLAASLGGTGVAGGAGCTLTLPNAATTITVGGTIALGGFTLTIPATGTAAIGAGTLSSTSTNNVTGATHTHAITVSPTLLGNGTAQYQVIVTGANPYVPVYSGFLLDGTTGGKTVFLVTNAKVLTFTATDTSGITFTGAAVLTVPATGTAALLNQANSFTLINPLTTIAESWIGPSATAGIYFKGGKVGAGTPNPIAKFDVMPNARTGTHPATLASAYFTGDLTIRDGFRIVHDNGTQGIAIGYSGIQKLANDSFTGAGNLSIDAMSTGDLLLQTISTGKVGIGTPDPGTALDILGIIQSSQLTNNVVLQHATNGRMSLRTTDSKSAVLSWSTNSFNMGWNNWEDAAAWQVGDAAAQSGILRVMNTSATTDVAFDFMTRAAASAAAPLSKVSILNNGNVGIGTPGAPGYTLDVNGTINAATAYRCGGTAPVADGTYCTGQKISGGGNNGSITTKGGIITAITPAS